MNILQEILGMFSIKRLAVWFGIFLLGFLLRGPLNRMFFTYKAEKRFPLKYKIEDARLENFIMRHAEVYDRNVKNIQHIALIAEKITADVLSFSAESTTTNPNLVFISDRTTNDAGYSAFYTTVCDYLIDYYSLKGYYDCYHLVGSCFFRTTNLTTVRSIRGRAIFPSEYHFNVIQDMKTGEIIALDPSLFDAYRISTVTSNYVASKP